MSPSVVNSNSSSFISEFSSPTLLECWATSC